MNVKITKTKMSLKMDSKEETKEETKEQVDCSICCESFSKSARSKVSCHRCNLEACKQCVRLYLMDTTSKAHCMGCKTAWERDFTQKSINKSYYNGIYKNKRKDLLFEGEKARFPETMPAVENYRNIKDWEKEKTLIAIKIENLRTEIRVAQREYSQVVTKIQNARDGVIVGKSDKHFIRKCPGDGCEGFLSSAWKCGACNLWACSKCFAEKGYDKNEAHTCNADDLASAELIKKETKGCPSCGIRIFKINGCDQMWCTGCHVAFSWKSGRRVNGVIHNPHFYAFQRDGATVIQNPGAQICGGLPTYHQIRDRKRALLEHPIFKKYGESVIEILQNEEGWGLYKRFTDASVQTEIDYCVQRLHRGANHFQHTVLDRCRTRCQQNQDNKRLRIEFICGEITIENMKTSLLKRDTALEKSQTLLDVYELMSAVYTECVIDIHNAMLDFINKEPNYWDSHQEKIVQRALHVGAVQKVLRRIHKNIFKVEKVRIYCNIELCKIGCIYNQSVNVIDGRYGTPSFNKENCKKELTKENAGVLHVSYIKNERGDWVREMSNEWHCNVVYI